MPAKYSQETFIEKAKQIHGDKYNYDKVCYMGATQKILILCNVCKQKFLQNAHSHLCGSGCPFCADKETSKRLSYNKEIFIEKAKKVHKNKYNYDKVIYTTSEHKVKIYCNTCKNYFEQTPHSHLAGCGCRCCAMRNHPMHAPLSLKKFIRRAKMVHGNIYDYSETLYKNSKTKVKIKCKSCNVDFYQNPLKHLRGQGCPFCSGSSGEKIIMGWLNDNNIEFTYQKWFNECKDILPLPFDFYIPAFNLCIEYQGKQHYDPQMFIALHKSKKEGMKKFNQQTQHDAIKKEYCKTHGILLFEIKYDENILDRLNNIFK